MRHTYTHEPQYTYVNFTLLLLFFPLLLLLYFQLLQPLQLLQPVQPANKQPIVGGVAEVGVRVTVAVAVAIHDSYL